MYLCAAHALCMHVLASLNILTPSRFTVCCVCPLISHSLLSSFRQLLAYSQALCLSSHNALPLHKLHSPYVIHFPLHSSVHSLFLSSLYALSDPAVFTIVAHHLNNKTYHSDTMFQMEAEEVSLCFFSYTAQH